MQRTKKQIEASLARLDARDRRLAEREKALRQEFSVLQLTRRLLRLWT
jgi:hypothetical protein